MHDDVVTHLHVVAKRELHELKAFELLSTAVEYVRREDATELDAYSHVTTAEQ